MCLQYEVEEAKAIPKCGGRDERGRGVCELAGGGLMGALGGTLGRKGRNGQVS